MTIVLHLPAQPDAPVACDMSTATDTPGERLAEYGRLFANALVRRDRREHAVVFTLSAAAREQAEDLAHREAACCPFLEYRVEATAGQVILTVTNPGRVDAEPILDGFYALPEQAVERIP
jgi:hypothetical protein